MILMANAMMGAAGHQAAASGEWWLPTGVAVSEVEQALQAKGAASYADSLIDLSGHTNATSIIAPGWTDAAGWQFNGSSHGIESNLLVPNDQTWSIFARFANSYNRSAGNYVFGQLKNTSGGEVRIMGIVRPALPGVFVYNGNDYFAYEAEPRYAGVFGFAGNTGYLDGVVMWSGTTLGDSFVDLTLTIGAAKHQSGILEAHYGGDILAFVAYNTALTTDQVAELTASMAAL